MILKRIGISMIGTQRVWYGHCSTRSRRPIGQCVHTKRRMRWASPWPQKEPVHIRVRYTGVENSLVSGAGARKAIGSLAKPTKERATGWRRLPAWAPGRLWPQWPIARAARRAPRERRASPCARSSSAPATAWSCRAGWLAIASPDSPTIILVHGFKTTRVSMLPWARFLYAANFNVLPYDSRRGGA